MESTPSKPVRPFLVIGHRGSPRRERENTIPSFHFALDEGADGIETDTRRLADGTHALFHDGWVGDQPTETLSLASLRAHVGEIDTLSSLIHQFGRRADGHSGSSDHPLLVIEIKQAGGHEDEIVDLVRGVNNVIVTTFDHRVVSRLATLDSSLELGIIITARLLHPAATVLETGARWFFPHFEFVDRATAGSCAEAGIGVIPWTVNRETLWANLRDDGCAGVITDLPGAAIAWRKRTESLC